MTFAALSTYALKMLVLRTLVPKAKRNAYRIKRAICFTLFFTNCNLD